MSVNAVKPNEETARLIAELRVNDWREVLEFEEEPEEPREAMKALVKLGSLAVEPLLELLKDASRYSCLYAIKVLGEIGDTRAAKPILEAFSTEEFRDSFPFIEEGEQPKIALQKMGVAALDAILEHLREMEEKDDWISICGDLEILEGIKDERSFRELVRMLSHPNDEVQATAIMSLGEYGDRRAVEHLANFLEDEKRRSFVLNSIRKLVSPLEYRAIRALYEKPNYQNIRETIFNSLRDIEWAYNLSKFEGDDAELLNFIKQEIEINKSIENLLSVIAKLAVDEAVISDEDYDKLGEVLQNIREKRSKFEKEYAEEINIISGYLLGRILKEEKRSFKGLAIQLFETEHSRLYILRFKVWEWLRGWGFRVIRKGSSLYAWRGSKGSRWGCYTAIAKDDERQRTWGLVYLILWGDGWASEEAEQFTSSFWQFVEKTVISLVGEKKFAKIILPTEQ